MLHSSCLAPLPATSDALTSYHDTVATWMASPEAAQHGWVVSRALAEFPGGYNEGGYRCMPDWRPMPPAVCECTSPHTYEATFDWGDDELRADRDLAYALWIGGLWTASGYSVDD